MGPSEHIVCLFMIEVTSDERPDSWKLAPVHHPIPHIKNVLTVKLLNVNLMLLLILALLVVQTAVLKNAFYEVGQGNGG